MGDFLGGIMDWIVYEVIDLSGTSAENIKITQEQMNLVQPIWQYFILFGVCLTIVYFVIELNKKWAFEGQSLSIKTVFIPFAKLTIAIILMANAAKLFGVLASFNNGFAEWSEGIATSFVYGGDEGNEVGASIMKNLDFWAKIIIIFPIIMAFSVTLICNLVWVYKALLYKVELIVRVAFAPIALADIYSGLNANAIKYIKGTLSLILYGGCLIMLPKLCIMIGLGDFMQIWNNLATGDVDAKGIFDIILAFVKIIVAPIAAIGLSSAAKNLLKEAVG